MSIDTTGMSSDDIRKEAKKRSQEIRWQNILWQEEILHLNLAAAQEVAKEQLLKDPNYVSHKISSEELSKVLRLIVAKDYRPRDAWDEMASDKKRHPEWLKNVKNKSTFYDEDDQLFRLEYTGCDAVELMKEHGTYNTRQFAAASTYSSTANKIHKALIKAKEKDKCIQDMRQNIEELTQQVSGQNKLLNQLNNQLLKKEEQVKTLVAHNNELSDGLLNADDFSPIEQARRLWSKGMSRKDIANKLGKSERTISRYTLRLAKGPVTAE